MNSSMTGSAPLNRHRQRDYPTSQPFGRLFTSPQWDDETIRPIALGNTEQWLLRAQRQCTGPKPRFNRRVDIERTRYRYIENGSPLVQTR